MRVSVRRSIGALSLGFWCAVNSIEAQEWTLTPSVAVSLAYSDNIDRTADDEMHEYIMRLRPGFDLATRTTRSSAQVSYALEATVYAEQEERNSTFHSLDADAIRRLSDTSSIAAGASLGQEVIDPTDTSIGAFASEDEVTSIFRAYVTPAWSRSFAGIYTTSAQFSQRWIEYSESELGDSRETEASARLDADARGMLAWGVEARRLDIKTDGRDDSSLSQASADVRVRAGPKLTLSGLFGYEDNEIAGAAEDEDTTGEYWQVGATWTPRSRDQFTLTHGERFFGRTTGFRWAHSGPVEVSVARSETLTTTSGLAFEEPAGDTTIGDLAPVPVSRGEVVVRTSSTVRITAGSGKSRYALTVNAAETDNQRTLVTDEEEGAAVGWTWRITGRNTLDTTLRYTRYRFLNDTREETVKRLSIGWRRPLREDAILVLRYEHTEGEDSEAINEFEENTAELSFRATF